MTIELAITDETPEDQQGPAQLSDEEILDCFLGAELNGSYRQYLLKAGRAIEAKALHPLFTVDQPLTLEQSVPGVRVCCGEFAKCHRACTPRGRWQATQIMQEIEGEFVRLEDLPAFIRRLQDEVRQARARA